MAVTSPRYLPPRAAYLHVPFCRHRCGYCNFTLLAGRDDLIGTYLEAIERELSWLGRSHAVDTLFFGGGTPTHLDLDRLAQLLDTVRDYFELSAEGEFSVEANPADVTPAKLELLRSAGVNRVSLGVQSFDSAKLQMLERDHRRQQVQRAVATAREFIPAVSVDLIFGVPGESLDTWQRDLEETLELAPDHVSTYGLTFERGARFWALRAKGELKPVDEATEQQMYEAALDTLTEAGLEHYEISNFARPGWRCRHNEVYWTGRTFFGFGPGAARHLDGRREINHRSTTTYFKRVLAGQSPVAESESLSPEASARERLAFGLRQLEVHRGQFAEETGFSIDSLAGPHLGELRQNALIEDTGPSIRLTRRGILLCDSICSLLLQP